MKCLSCESPNMKLEKETKWFKCECGNMQKSMHLPVREVVNTAEIIQFPVKKA